MAALSDAQYPTPQELAPGKSLAQVVAGGWRGGEAEVKQLAAQILETLQYLGSRRPPVTHRQAQHDIKNQKPFLSSHSQEQHVQLFPIATIIR